MLEISGITPALCLAPIRKLCHIEKEGSSKASMGEKAEKLDAEKGRAKVCKEKTEACACAGVKLLICCGLVEWNSGGEMDLTWTSGRMEPHPDNSDSCTDRMEPHPDKSVSCTARMEPHSDNSISCLARMMPPSQWLFTHDEDGAAL
ncbi:hypothetical protein PoB_006149800 [Plakobranchus ocellatus]|uniref:Uncharacterized protein n=1 Tax=Plakobranchus ocellatus TaxID=259542 RepID=A0AAV4CST7_9GAST|nr:hypothetical protein PoB_006149800 [Plakobranchus ocellatus]